MALGATTRTILVLFMLKAVFLALIGGILGYGIGTLVAVLLAPRLLQIHAYPILSLIPWAVDGCGVQCIEQHGPLMARIQNGSR